MLPDPWESMGNHFVNFVVAPIVVILLKVCLGLEQDLNHTLKPQDAHID